jgi:hypothetical protein
MLYREIFAVWSQIHTKLLNTQCGHDCISSLSNFMVHKVTTVLYKTAADRNLLRLILTLYITLCWGKNKLSLTPVKNTNLWKYSFNQLHVSTLEVSSSGYFNYIKKQNILRISS